MASDFFGQIHIVFHFRSTWKQGFTLSEAIATVLIIGIVATIAVPTYRTATERARVQEAQATLNMIFQAERIYRLDQVNPATGQNTYGTGPDLSGNRYMDDPNLTNNDWNFVVPDPGHLDPGHRVASPTVFSAVAIRTGGGWNNATIGLDEGFTGDPITTPYPGGQLYYGDHPLRD